MLRAVRVVEKPVSDTNALRVSAGLEKAEAEVARLKQELAPARRKNGKHK